MRWLLSGDLHLTDNPSDTYRWKVFATLECLCKKYSVSDLFLLGDLTDDKDRHNANLVNSVVNNITTLAKNRVVHILAGNHDYITQSTPYFSFLRHIPGVNYYCGEPVVADVGRGRVLMVPHTHEFKEKFREHLSSKPDLICMHQTVSGAESESGRKLDGCKKELFKNVSCPIISGDIHVPQQIGKVLYCGAPHQIHFGDKFKPRLLLVGAAKGASLRIQSVALGDYLQRLSLRIQSMKDLKELKFNPGDQLKLTIQLSTKNLQTWQELRERAQKWCSENDLYLASRSEERRVGKECRSRWSPYH